ncbi:hypothetical protein BJB45_06820 [Halomonas huangheensis]|uniref:Uncharacterized protein n=1 Tax=Halomonas huangheensis TaxID=1178482 RepID=W1N1L0_9GAMM|nr:hypothetical protein BJB45_06820 [Halomonas huangheensis]
MFAEETQYLIIEMIKMDICSIEEKSNEGSFSIYRKEGVNLIESMARESAKRKAARVS